MKALTKWTTTCVWLILAIAATVFLTVPKLGAAETKDGVFIHITSGKEDPQRLLMALSMARLMSADHDVLVYFDIKAVGAVLKDAADITYAQFVSSKEQLSALPTKGVILMVCPECLKAAGKTPSELADCVEMADKNRFFSFTKGRILTLDY